MGAYGGQRTWATARTVHTMEDFITGLPEHLQNEVRQAFVAKYGPAINLQRATQAEEQWTDLLKVAYDAIYAALNGDTYALVHLPTGDRQVIIDCIPPRRSTGQVWRLKATVRNSTMEASTYAWVGWEEADRVAGATGHLYTTYRAEAQS